MVYVMLGPVDVGGKMFVRALSLLLLAVAAGCGSVPGVQKQAKDPGLALPAGMASAPPPDDAVTYTCENGATFKARFSDQNGSVRIEPKTSAPYTLYISATGSGFDYRDGGRDLRGKGDEAMWTDKGAPTTKCMAKPAT